MGNEIKNIKTPEQILSEWITVPKYIDVQKVVLKDVKLFDILCAMCEYSRIYKPEKQNEG